jgi:hypothetical protein
VRSRQKKAEDAEKDAVIQAVRGGAVDARPASAAVPLGATLEDDDSASEQRQSDNQFANMAIAAGAKSSPEKASKAKKEMNESQSLSIMQEEESNAGRACTLCSLSLADNQMDYFTGHALAMLLEKNKHLTHLDISGNSLGHAGGLLFTDELEKCYGIKPRDFVKLVLYDIEQKKFEGRDPKRRKKVFTSLTSLDISRNGIGPNVMACLSLCMGHPSCTITDLDVSDNPIGVSVESGGLINVASHDIRYSTS